MDEKNWSTLQKKFRSENWRKNSNGKMDRKHFSVFDDQILN